MTELLIPLIIWLLALTVAVCYLRSEDMRISGKAIGYTLGSAEATGEEFGKVWGRMRALERRVNTLETQVDTLTRVTRVER